MTGAIGAPGSRRSGSRSLLALPNSFRVSTQVRVNTATCMAARPISRVRVDLASLGFWNGLSLTPKAEQNFGQSVNGLGRDDGALQYRAGVPGNRWQRVLDVSSLYFAQNFGRGVSLVVGKVNMIDAAASKPFAGGAGITSFWNTTFAAPPSGLVPPYLLGALLSVSTPKAKYNLWVYDPVDCVNQSCLEAPFAQGVTVRGNIDIPVTLGGLSGIRDLFALQHV